MRFDLMQLLQWGFSSPHLIRRLLQVKQPVFVRFREILVGSLLSTAVLSFGGVDEGLIVDCRLSAMMVEVVEGLATVAVVVVEAGVTLRSADITKEHLTRQW